MMPFLKDSVTLKEAENSTLESLAELESAIQPSLAGPVHCYWVEVNQLCSNLITAKGIGNTQSKFNVLFST